MSRPLVTLVVGARPNFVKAAPVLRALTASGRFGTQLIHTGQHYDRNLSDVFFADLEMAAPDLELGVGSGSHAVQTAKVMTAIEPVLEAGRPSAVVVFGDVNSTVAAALTAVKLGIPVAHVESGLRSFDRAMPEEINRLVTDRLATLLFTTEESANRNLEREGTPGEQIAFVGNSMVDSLFAGLERARAGRPAVYERLAIEPEGYAVLTLHRPSNVDRPEVLAGVLEAVGELASQRPVIFPVHPRTRARLEEIAGSALTGLRLVEPLGYLEFLGLLDGARLVLTDSGGIQEETTALGVPCLTLRDNTERPVTLTAGTNRLVGSRPESVRTAVAEVLAAPARSSSPSPPLWDGRAAERMVEEMERWLT